MITVGADLMGPELARSPIDQAIMEVGRRIAAARGDWQEGSAPAVNVVFYVPGSLGTFDIPGIEASRFSRRQKMLLIAVPVPGSLVKSDRATDFVIDAMYKANAIAADVFAKKGVPEFSREEADRIVDKVKDALRGQGNQCSTF